MENRNSKNKKAKTPPGRKRSIKPEKKGREGAALRKEEVC